MSTVYAIEHTKFLANKKVTAGEWSGKLHYYKAVYEAAALADGSTIYCFRPAAGLKVTGWGYVTSDALGNSTTLAVGIVGATTKFMAATSHSSAAQTKMMAVADIAVLVPAPTTSQSGYEFDGSTDVIITTGTGAGTGTIVIEMMLVGP